ncbi:MAG TPA: L-threonylcarbamoyladenylate synthase [Gammaproteobacteria bacterium]|nr:L-threonylcarbamoyladenylate synthase [Gammaproteobacteria bacterium]
MNEAAGQTPPLAPAVARAVGQAADVLRSGGVVAYPTEAVYGLGCDPHNEAAVQRILDLKGRGRAQGMILIAADFEQIASYIDVDTATAERLRASWPGPITWVVAARPEVPEWIRGEHPSVAVRVTDHAASAALCRAFGGALVSTSANRSGEPPARSAADVAAAFGDGVDFIIDAPVGGRERPSEIRDAATGRVLRPA